MLKIFIDELSFERSTSELTGPVWAQFDGISFPEKNWDDFVVIVLLWWCQSIFDYEDHDKTILWTFMDGPFDINFIEHKDSFEAVARHCDQIVATANTTLDEMRNLLIDAIDNTNKNKMLYESENKMLISARKRLASSSGPAN
tara:strand:- start:21660 stop:22088 length:429 start_codon:yes stop_codon:yes gene_type:complete